jgi:hypothetical protein
MKWQFLTFAIVLFVAVSFGGQQDNRTQKDVIKEVFGSQQNFETFLNSKKITVYRLHLRDKRRSGFLSSYLQGSPILLTPEHAHDIRLFLQRPSSYDWLRISKCSPEYGVLFVFRSEQHVICMAWCLKCGIVSVFDSDNDNTNRINIETQFSDAGQRIAIAMAKSIFPNDSEFQNLK